jgi:predicted DsbA family dithiol-disulfide isomerase/uncharacterized membrane protein
MFVVSLYAALYFYSSHFPTLVQKDSLCDINTVLNCDAIAYSVLADVRGVPLGYFGMLIGALVCIGAIFPSPDFERTNRTIALLNVLGASAHLLFSAGYLKSLCLPCIGYTIFAAAVFILFREMGTRDGNESGITRFLRPAIKHMTTFVVVAVLGAIGLSFCYEKSGETRVVERFFSLPEVEWPSLVSPYRVASATERFEDAPLRIVVYSDLLCGDCLMLYRQMKRLSRDFEGKLNVAFQFFPLDARCNDVVDKNSHPGACDLSYIAAHNPERFREIYDDIFSNFESVGDEAWRAGLAERYGVEAALDDPATKDLVYRILRTGAEYEKTSDRWRHGIRSTPTMIVNNRMLIGTFPYAHLRTIFAALVEGRDNLVQEKARKKFMEHWVMD